MFKRTYTLHYLITSAVLLLLPSLWNIAITFPVDGLFSLWQLGDVTEILITLLGTLLYWVTAYYILRHMESRGSSAFSYVYFVTIWLSLYLVVGMSILFYLFERVLPGYGMVTLSYLFWYAVIVNLIAGIIWGSVLIYKFTHQYINSNP